MRRTSPSQSGFTLIELVVTIVLTSIIMGALVFFLYPLRQAVDVTVRADLTEAADSALRRVGRDVRLALPNSVRVATDTNGRAYLEYLAVRTAGRYRMDGQGAGGGSLANCASNDATLNPLQPNNDQLSFDVSADTCFKTIGIVPDLATIVTGSDFLVLNNYGSGFTGQDAYAGGSPPASNRTSVTAASNDATLPQSQIQFGSVTFSRTLHDSVGKRFFVISGPVAYVCDPLAGTLTRYWNYAIQANQCVGQAAAPCSGSTNMPPAGASSALLATQVTACQFNYSQNASPQAGLLSMLMTLSKNVSSGIAEQVSLYHAIHVSNVP
jgi:MSHA biogenesis protein MshO